MKNEVEVKLNTDDIAWVSRKLSSHYAVVVKSDVFSEEEKQTEINILMSRAARFGLYELVDRFGWMRIVIPLENNREFVLVWPKKYEKADVERLLGIIELLPSKIV